MEGSEPDMNTKKKTKENSEEARKKSKS